MREGTTDAFGDRQLIALAMAMARRGGSPSGGWYGLTVATLAALAAQPTSPSLQGRIAFVQATEGYYSWNPGSVVTPDGYLNVAGNGGVWTFFDTQAGTVYVRPIDGTTDDAPGLGLLWQASAYKCKVVMLPGLLGQSFQFKTPQATPSGLYLEGDPGTTVVVNVPQTSIFNGLFNMCAAQSGVHNLIAAANTPGTNTLSVTSSVPIGTAILALNAATGLLGCVYIVTNVSGGGPFTITLDRECVYTFGTTDFVLVCQPNTAYPTGLPQDVVIEGRGMRVVATEGDILVEMLCASNCKVRHLKFTLNATGINAVTTDTGSRDCEVSDCTVDGNSLTGTQGYWCQGNNHQFLRNRAKNCNAVGLAVISAVNCNADSNHIEGTTAGANILVASDGSPTTNAECGFGNVLSKNHTTGGAGAGISLANGANETTCVGNVCKFTTTGNAGLRVAGTDVVVPPRDCILQGNDLSDNADGLYINVGTIGLVVDGVTVSRCSGSGVNWQGKATIKNVVGYGYTTASANVVACATSSSGSIDGLDAECADLAPGNCLALKLAGAANIRARNVELLADGQNVEMVSLAGTSKLRLSSATFGGTHAGSAIGIAIASGCTLRLSEDNSIDASGLPLNPAGGSFVSPGTLTLNGATPVVTSFPDLKTTDTVLTEYSSLNGGVPTTPPVVTQTAGTGFSTVAAAGDTGILRYRLVG